MQMVNEDDRLLIERHQSGDADAFDELVRRYIERAYQYAFRLTRDPDEAADVVAESMLRVLRALPSFRGGSTFSTWLYRIVTNCFLDMRKKRSYRLGSDLERMFAGDEVLAQSPYGVARKSTYAAVVRRECMARIEQAVEALPEYQKLIVVMYHAEALSYEEIAEILNLPVGTVKSRLNRARQGIRRSLHAQRDLFVLA